MNKTNLRLFPGLLLRIIIFLTLGHLYIQSYEILEKSKFSTYHTQKEGLPQKRAVSLFCSVEMNSVNDTAFIWRVGLKLFRAKARMSGMYLSLG